MRAHTDDATLVLAMARRIEPCREKRLAWFHEDPIVMLGSRTADELVKAGETARLVAMIRAIDAAERALRTCPDRRETIRARNGW